MAPTNNDIEDNQSQTNKCMDRCPTPVPGTLFTFPDYSDTEYPDSNVGTPIHAQYKGNLTTTNASQDQNSSTDSELPVSDTETESNYTIQMDNTNFSSLQDHIVHLPRPSCSPRPTNQHKRPCFNKNQQIGSLTRSTDETTSAPASNIMQPNTNQCKQPNQAHTYSAPVRKSPLLPTPPASERVSSNTNYQQCITRPSAPNNRNPTFTRPSPFYNRSYNQHISRPLPSPPRYNTHPTFSGPANYSYYLQPHIPGPHTAFPPYLHQNFITGPYQQTPLLPLPAPYQQTSGHFPQQVYYVPIILPHYTI